jgi:peptidoglycan hydrolase-like protein with peptidoglycan-binding domain
VTTRSQFAWWLLEILGIEPQAANVQALVSWMNAENCNAANNPLATTMPGYGSQNLPEWNAAGVKQYPTLDDGLQATAATLTNGLYGPILAALRGPSAQAVETAVERSPWGTEPFAILPQDDSAAYNVEVGSWEPSPSAPAPAPAPAPDPTPAPAPAPAPSGPGYVALATAPLLMVGNQGFSVGCLQKLLGVPVDGIFGPATKAAVVAFQAAHGLAQDGQVGPETWRELL